MSAMMTLSEFLALPSEYRSVSENRCRVLKWENGSGTVLEPVTITGDYVSTRERKVRGGYLVATARTHALGPQAPYFSVTGELWDSEGWYRNGQQGRLRSCGTMPEDILRAFPQLAPLVALHLADAVTGEPMYAFENGWYHYSRGDVGAAASLLRCDVPEGMSKDEFRTFVVAQEPRWEREAEEGRRLILDGIA